MRLTVGNVLHGVTVNPTSEKIINTNALYMFNMDVEEMTKPAITFYTVFNRVINECAGDNFSAEEAFDAVIRLNREDNSEDWAYYANDSVKMLDSMMSLVQDHHSI